MSGVANGNAFRQFVLLRAAVLSAQRCRSLRITRIGKTPRRVNVPYLAADRRTNEKFVQNFSILRLTFPYGQDVPSVLPERFRSVPIALYVLPELVVPELDSGLRHCASSTSFVAMPKAPVNEDNQAVLGEDDIRRSRQVATVHAKAEAQAMGCSAHDDFRCGVLPPNTSHERGSLRRGRSFQNLAGLRVLRIRILRCSHQHTLALGSGPPTDSDPRPFGAALTATVIDYTQ